MLGHVSIGVRDLAAATRFYDAVLPPIGWIRLWTGPDGLGYGPPGGGEKLNIFVHADARPPGPGFPGLRPQYDPDYYAAFVADPEGWKLEALHKASWD